MMSRWRPPHTHSTDLISRQGHDLLKQRLHFLWHESRPAVVRALSDAAAEGDRSENAEYIYRKKQLADIDRQVRYLTQRLSVLHVVETLPTDRQRIFLVQLCT